MLRSILTALMILSPLFAEAQLETKNVETRTIGVCSEFEVGVRTVFELTVLRPSKTITYSELTVSFIDWADKPMFFDRETPHSLKVVLKREPLDETSITEGIIRLPTNQTVLKHTIIERKEGCDSMTWTLDGSSNGGGDRFWLVQRTPEAGKKCEEMKPRIQTRLKLANCSHFDENGQKVEGINLSALREAVGK